MNKRAVVCTNILKRVALFQTVQLEAAWIYARQALFIAHIGLMVPHEPPHGQGHEHACHLVFYLARHNRLDVLDSLEGWCNSEINHLTNEHLIFDDRKLRPSLELVLLPVVEELLPVSILKTLLERSAHPTSHCQCLTM